MSKRKRERRKQKQDRKNLKLWAEGAREDILLPYVEEYADAAAQGYVAERDCL